MNTIDTEFRDQVFNRYLRLLAKTEWASEPQLVRYQSGLISNLVRHARDNVPFYRHRLAHLFTSDGHPDLSRWEEVPIVTRAEAAVHATAMRSLQLAPIHGGVSEVQTSGSTGTPLSIASNELTSVAANAALTRMARWWGVNTSRPLARIRVYHIDAPQYPEGFDGKGWSYSDQEAAVHDLDLTTPVEQQLEWLSRKKAPYLLTSPSNAMALAHAASPDQARELAIEIVFAVAETVLPRTREVVAERLGARMAAIYSCEEIGFVATQCPATSAYHVVVETAFVEIVNENGSAVAPGEVGQVVLTGLYNYAMPFIRYAIGDVAVAAEGRCPCGRRLPVIAQVLGRTRCAFIFEDGTRVWPRSWDGHAMRMFIPYREFQMVQLDHRRIEFRYVPDGTDRHPDSAGLDAYVRTKIHPSANVVPVPMKTIPRGPGGKLDPFISLIPA
jgi:phenylacetate-coenzyme A ligase PaaK-like adenylate-forming protein